MCHKCECALLLGIGSTGPSAKKITGKADVGFVSDKLKSHVSKVKAITANIPVDARANLPGTWIGRARVLAQCSISGPIPR